MHSSHCSSTKDNQSFVFPCETGWGKARESLIYTDYASKNISKAIFERKYS